MTIAEYQNLTGTTVLDADATRVQAVIRRCESRLETLLGYSLSKQKKWTELGKVPYNGLVPFPSLPLGDVTLSTLGAPDNQNGDIQLFNFSTLDKHFRINPAKEIYKAKIVLPINSDEFVTIYELDYVMPFLNQAGLVVAISRYYTWFAWTWWNSLLFTDKSNLMLAVDADYINACNADKYPDLAYLLADMVTYYTDPAYSMLGNLREESIDSHSYQRALSMSKYVNMAPEAQASAKLIIDKYAGPAAYRKQVA